MSAPTPQDVRHELLEPYLQRVRAFLRAHGDESRPLTIPCEPVPLHLSPPERQAAWSVLCSEASSWSDARAWVALGAALHLAVATTLDSVARGDADARERLDAVRSVASSTMEGLRQAIATLLVGGQNDEARWLSLFRNKLLEILALMRAAAAPPPHASPPAAEAPAPAPAAPPVAAPRPTADLGPYLRRAAAFLRARGHQERPLTVSFGQRSLALSAWENRILWRSLCEGQTPTADWHALIPESVALRLAMLLALDEIERAGPDAQACVTARAELQAVVEIAPTVVEGFRARTGSLVGAGAVEDAKRLAALSAEFAATLGEARRALAAGSAAGTEADAGTAPPSDAAPAGGGAEADPPERLRAFVERAAYLLEVHGRDDRPLSIPVAGTTWNLDSWERQVLWKVLCEEGPPPPDWARLLAHGAAVQLAALLALERVRNAGSSPEARAAAETDRTAAAHLGAEVVERLRATAEAQAADGKEKLAQQLARFGARLADTLRPLTGLLAPGERD